MKVDREKKPIGKFPLRLMPSVRKVAEEFSRHEGVSLNQFINVAVAEKVAHLQHEQWVARLSRATAERISRALKILDRGTNISPEPGDELPEGYRSIRETDEYKKAAGDS
jgi:hypothetical protein